MDKPQPYCLDSNVLIQAWRQYYAPKICPTYWDVMRRLGKAGRIFIGEMVYNEIARTDDDLSEWLKESDIEVHKTDGRVGEQVKKIFEADPNHKFLVDNKSGRSLADPWVIAHALAVDACVVTKENIALQGKNRIKIPNVCHNMNVRCINDFEFVNELASGLSVSPYCIETSLVVDYFILKKENMFNSVKPESMQILSKFSFVRIFSFGKALSLVL